MTDTTTTTTASPARDARLPGRGQAAAAPDDPLAVQPTRRSSCASSISNASDAADKLRFEALDASRAATRAIPTSTIRVAFDKEARTITVARQRHRHVARRGDRPTSAPSPSRARASSSQSLTGDQAKDAQPDRPVRRRLLLVVHRRRPGHAGDAPRRAAGEQGVRWESAGEGEYTIETRRHGRRAAPRSSCTCARARTSCCRAGGCARSSASTPTTSRCPIVMTKEEWDEEKKAYRATDEDETVNQASALWARPKAEITDGAVRGVLQARRARLRAAARLRRTRKVEGRTGVHAAALHAGARAVRPVGPRAPARHQAVRAARVHHGRRRAAAAGLPALRARRGRFERPAAQRLARDPAGVERRRGDPQRLRQARARPARGPRRERARRSTRRSGTSSAAC